MGRLHAGIPPANRPGIPPAIVTWADPAYLADFCKDIAALRPKVDVLVASCHWGLGREPLQYMTEIGRAAIDAGADVVVGHGPHYSLPVELYKGRPIYYGLGNLCFKTGHLGRRHENWIGMVAKCCSRTEGAALIISASSATMPAMKPYSNGQRTRPRCLRTSPRAARRSAPRLPPRTTVSTLLHETIPLIEEQTCANGSQHSSA